MSRRLKVLRVPDLFLRVGELVTELLTLPPDAEVVRLSEDHLTAHSTILLSHWTFPEVEDGDLIPVVEHSSRSACNCDANYTGLPHAKNCPLKGLRR
jgi:hypothetical protein